MNYTKEQIEKMADEYANQFIDGRDHFYAFKAGFEKALSLFAVSGRSEQLKALIHFAEFAKEEYGLHIPLNLIKEYVKAFNCH